MSETAEKPAISSHGPTLSCIRCWHPKPRRRRSPGQQAASASLPITDDAIVLDRGAIVHAAPSAQLLGDREQLDRWLAVARA